MTKFLIFFALILMLSGCDYDYQEGYKKGFGDGVKAQQKESKNDIEKISNTLSVAEKLIEKNKQKEEELDEKEKEIKMVESLWKSVAYPDLVLARGLIINVPVFSVWLVPFLAWMLVLALMSFWYAKKYRQKIKPTPEELKIIEAAKEAKNTIQELQKNQKQHENELAEIQKCKTKTNQEVNKARDELARIKNGINQRKNEIDCLSQKIEELKQEIQDLTI